MDSYTCSCARRLLTSANGEFCVRCLKPPANCTCRPLATREDGWGEAAFFPRGKYRIEEEAKGWAVLTRDDGGAFT